MFCICPPSPPRHGITTGQQLLGYLNCVCLTSNVFGFPSQKKGLKQGARSGLSILIPPELLGQAPEGRLSLNMFMQLHIDFSLLKLVFLWNCSPDSLPLCSSSAWCIKVRRPLRDKELALVPLLWPWSQSVVLYSTQCGCCSVACFGGKPSLQSSCW